VKYFCLAYGDERKWDAMSQPEKDAAMSQAVALDKEFRRSTQVTLNEGLKWGATTIRMRNGKVTVTDGPFAETREVVGGVFVVEARDLNEAIQVASKHPGACMGENLGWGVEVREIESFG
jgi:hypothetical protein